LNLIPHNPFDGSGFGPPAPERVRAFQAFIHEGGIRCLLRGPRGQDIAAACGQLTRASRGHG
jgi:23S rRNA (adenine2503-C2)-methyltransferase